MSNIIMIHLFPSFVCNLKCTHCYVDAQRHRPWLTSWNDEILAASVNLVNKLNSNVVHIEWWEPLMYSKIFDLIERIKNKESITMVTNGVLANEKNVSRLASVWLKKVVISLEWHNEKLNSKIRWKGFFEKIINSVKLFVNNWIYTSLSMTITKTNHSYLDNYIKLAISLWVNEVRLWTLISVWSWSNIKNLILDKLDISIIVKKYISIVEKYWNDIIVKLSIDWKHLEKNVFSDNREFYSCNAWSTQFAIWNNWDIYPCYNSVFSTSCIMWNIFDVDIDNILGTGLKGIKKELLNDVCPINFSGHTYYFLNNVKSNPN